MDTTFVQHPAVLIALVSAIVGLIVKAVRLQTRVDKLEGDLAKQAAASAEQKAILAAHERNTDIHFNVRVAQEVDKGNERRFQTIEKQLSEVIHKLDAIASKQ